MFMIYEATIDPPGETYCEDCKGYDIEPPCETCHPDENWEYHFRQWRHDGLVLAYRLGASRGHSKGELFKFFVNALDEPQSFDDGMTPGQLAVAIVEGYEDHGEMLKELDAANPSEPCKNCHRWTFGQCPSCGYNHGQIETVDGERYDEIPF